MNSPSANETFNPLRNLSAELLALLSSQETLLSIVENHFTSLDQVLRYLSTKDNIALSPALRQKLTSLYANATEGLTILEGHEHWKRWRGLLADVFFFFEYMYEEGSGSGDSYWSVAGFSSKFSHKTNHRLSREDRRFYNSNIAIKDKNDVVRAELLRTVSQNITNSDELMEQNWMTESQMAITSYSLVNDVLQGAVEDTIANQSTLGVFHKALRGGEMVVRMFGMKDEDNLLTSHNPLLKGISNSPIKSNSDTIFKSKTPHQVHRGFLNVYQALQKGCLKQHGVDFEEHIVRNFRELQQRYPNVENRRIVFTGHSMGAAFACFAAYRIICRYSADSALCDGIHLILFGAPKFANLPFASWVNSVLGSRLILINSIKDRIPSLPPVFKWYCPGIEKVLVTSDGLRAAVERQCKLTDSPVPSLEREHFLYWNVIRYGMLCFDPASTDKIVDSETFLKAVVQRDYDFMETHSLDLKLLSNHSQNQSGQFALHIAASQDDLRMAKLLIAAGANVNATDFYGCTPLHNAAMDCAPRLCELLIESDANVNFVNDRGSTAFHYLTRWNDFEIAKPIIDLFIANGANINAVNNDQSSPLLTAVESISRNKTAAYLLTLNANVNQKTVQNFSPLFLAVQSQHVSTVQLLLQHNADPDIECGMETVRAVVAREGTDEIKELFNSY